MADNTRVNELQDKLLKAMDILNAQALNSISFDKTILCTIETDKDKKDGKYEVNDGNRIFTVYSNDTRLKVGDAVYVTVPEGKFENQKMIVGKKVLEKEEPFIFINPFDTFFDMTGNLAQKESVSSSLLANDSDILFKTIFDKDFNQEDDLIKYDRLGIRADFRSWIRQAVTGRYGIYVIITTENNTEDPYTFFLDNSKMYGNPYSFETYYTQELLINLENKDMGLITNIKVNFFQDANFYDKFDNKISCFDDFNENETKKLADNLFVDNLEIYFGYDISKFTTDYVELYTQDQINYKRSINTDESEIIKDIGNNKKRLKIRWVHIADGQPVDMVTAAKKDSSASKIDYEVRWYKYSVGAPAADPYCGVYWERIENADKFSCDFDPVVNRQQEKIKAIIICESIPYRSNELIFTNEEELPPSQKAQHIANALVIIPSDKSNGNYMIYGQDNSIKDTLYSKETRTIEAWFDIDSNGEIDLETEKINDDGIANLLWTFPDTNSMIELINGDETDEIDENGNKILSKTTVTGKLPQYKIKSYYSPSYSNNTIQCQYSLNDMVYTTEKEFTFGPAGTMGTDQTLIIDFVGDKNAIDINNINLKHQLQVQLYDNQNKLITDFQDATIEWSFYYQTDENLEIQINNEDKTKADLIFKSGFNINSLYIVKVKIGTLETYFPLPIKNGYSYIKGPTQVIYQADGEPAYNREEYKLYSAQDEAIDASWSIIADESIYTYKYLGKLTQEEYDKLESCYIVQQEGTETTPRKYELATDFNSEVEYYQQIDNGYCGKIKNNKLYPLSIYIKDTPVYGVQAKIDSTTVWTQPILVLQNQWPNGVINQWDGESLVMDHETQTILAAAISAGKKNSDNTFSGVMMGDWGSQDVESSLRQTGVYGFHHGAMSYAFKEDGTAFLGKDGKGRINFDGNNATLYSNNWEERGMKIDLDAPWIKLTNGRNSIIIDATKSGTVSSANSSNAPFKIGSNFAVAWDGTLYAEKGEFTGTINAESGTIGGWEIDGDILKSEDGDVILNGAEGTISGAYISGGTIDGSTIKGIEIEGVNITGADIYAGTLHSDSRSNRIYLDGYLTLELDNGEYADGVGRLGYIKSTADGDGMGNEGIGIICTTGRGTTIDAKVLATGDNAGMSYLVDGDPMGWISIGADGIDMGGYFTDNLIDTLKDILGIYNIEAYLDI